MAFQKSKGSTVVAVIIAVVVTLLIVGIGYLYAENVKLQRDVEENGVTETQQESEDESTREAEEKDEEESREREESEEPKEEPEEKETKETASPCDFTKEYDFKTTTQYGIFGDDTFDTAVCGYVTTQEEVIFDEPVETAYFVVLKFMDEGFKKSLKDGINMGNSMNQLVNANVTIGLGCMENGALVNHGNTLIHLDAADAILASAPDKPVALILSFEEHGGFGASCAALMEEVKLY